MAVQKGRNLLIKVNDGSSPESFTTIAGVRSRTITVNQDLVDITDSDNAPWRSLLADAGLKQFSITVSGIFKDDTAQRRMKDLAFTGDLESFQVVFGNGDTMDGEFLVASIEEGGEHVGEQVFNFTLESSGKPTFVRAVP